MVQEERLEGVPPTPNPSTHLIMRLNYNRRREAFTLIELMVVIGIVCMLMGLVLGIQKYAQAKSNRSRAEVLVAGLVSAAEAYKSDNAVYPRSKESDSLSSLESGGGSSYQAASMFLYATLSGDADGNGTPDGAEGKAGATPSYFNFGPSTLKQESGSVSYIKDPWGNPIGYSTKRAASLEKGSDSAQDGHNVTFDVWSTGGQDSNPKSWIGNW